MAASTPAIAELRAAGLAFSEHRYRHDPGAAFGMEAAQALSVPEQTVFKTLLCVVDDRPHVAIISVNCQLDLKAVATAAAGKRAEMMPVAVAERLTGYIAGGISPFGQRKRLPTLVDASAELYEVMYVSAGRRGFDIGIAPGDLISLLHATVADIAR